MTTQTNANNGNQVASLNTARERKSRKPAKDYSDEHFIGFEDTYRAVLQDKGFWDVAATLPGNYDAEYVFGRKTANPSWVMLMFVCLTPHFGTQRRTFAELTANNRTWKRVVRYANKKAVQYLGENCRLATSTRPHSSQLKRFLAKWDKQLSHQVADKALHAASAWAVSVAQERDYYNPCQNLKYSQPDFHQWIVADGTVFAGPSKKTEGKRIDSASTLHYTGEKRWVQGSKFVLIETPNNGSYRGSLILAIEHVKPKAGKTGGDEAGSILRLVDDLNTLASNPTGQGIKGLVTDSVMRGKHHESLLNQGIILTSYPHAAKNPDGNLEGRNSETRVEQTRKIKIHRHGPNDDCEHDIWMNGSAPTSETINLETGELIYTPLRTSALKTTKSPKTGKYQFRLEVAVPCVHYGEFKTFIRLDAPQQDDLDHRLSRPELARAYPAGTEAFDEIYGWRNQTESMHSQLKNKMHRLPAYGAKKQTLFILGAQIMTNALSVYVEKRQQKRDGTTPPDWLAA